MTLALLFLIAPACLVAGFLIGRRLSLDSLEAASKLLEAAEDHGKVADRMDVVAEALGRSNKLSEGLMGGVESLAEAMREMRSGSGWRRDPLEQVGEVSREDMNGRERPADRLAQN